jgi:hypothetical protein
MNRSRPTFAHQKATVRYPRVPPEVMTMTAPYLDVGDGYFCPSGTWTFAVTSGLSRVRRRPRDSIRRVPAVPMRSGGRLRLTARGGPRARG